MIICVIENVKEKMLSCRSFFRKSATAVVGAGVGLVILSQGSYKNKKKQFKDIKKWISKYGEIPNGACVAMNSGWDKNVNSDKFRELYTIKRI